MRFSTVSAPAIAALILVASPAAQDTVDRAMVAKIRSEGLDRSKVYATFSHLVTVVGPRLTATPEYKAAADWSREQLASYGLQNPRLEAGDFGRGWQLEKFTLEMIEPRYMPRTIDVRFGARVGLSPYPEPDTYVGEDHG